MLDLFESLPLPATTLISAAVSITVVALISRVTPGLVTWMAALVVPFVVAYSLYWAPVWISHRPNVADYSAWEVIFVGLWGFAGVIGSLGFVLLLRSRRRVKRLQP
jgi:uncharacterized membrane protein